MEITQLLKRLQEDEQVASWLRPSRCDGREDRAYVSQALWEQEATLSSLLQSFSEAEGYPNGDLRALSSLWSRWYFWAGLPTVMAGLTLHRCVPRWKASRCTHVHHEFDLSWLPELRVVSTDQWEQVRESCELVVSMYEPLILVLAKLSKASAKVFWNNLGNQAEYLFVQLQKHPSADCVVLRAWEQLFSEPVLSNGRPNPLCKPVRYVTEKQPSSCDTARRIRKLCCLNYLLPDLELCSNCPRPNLLSSHV